MAAPLIGAVPPITFPSTGSAHVAATEAKDRTTSRNKEIECLLHVDATAHDCKWIIQQDVIISHMESLNIQDRRNIDPAVTSDRFFVSRVM